VLGAIVPASRGGFPAGVSAILVVQDVQVTGGVTLWIVRVLFTMFSPSYRWATSHACTRLNPCIR